jgi:hypothetical protein
LFKGNFAIALKHERSADITESAGEQKPKIDLYVDFPKTGHKCSVLNEATTSGPRKSGLVMEVGIATNGTGQSSL